MPAGPRPGWAASDADGNGALDLREYHAGLTARLGRADLNRDGVVSSEELAAFRPRHGRHRF
jgi:hypothetical protein